MLVCLRRCNNSLLPMTRTISKQYHWVYQDKEDGYDERAIEEKFQTMSSGGSIDLQQDGYIAHVTINNPTKRNAFTGSMIVALRNVVEKLSEWKGGKAVVLTGKGNTFCSGLDLVLAKQLTTPQDGRDMCMYMQNTLMLFQRLPMMTLAALKGDVLGGGAEVATATDFRIMFPNSRLRFLQKKMGIIPGWGAATRLRRIVGPRKSMYLLASGEDLDCKSALLAGLVDALASDDDTPTRLVAEEWLEETFKLSETDSAVYAAIKSATNDFSDCERLLRRERDLLGSVWGGPSHKKALDLIKIKR